MISGLVILLIVVVNWLLGWAIVRLFWQVEPLFPVERYFLYLTVGLSVMGWFAFVLAEIGLFSLLAIGGVWLFLFVGTFVVKRRFSTTASLAMPQSSGAPEPNQPMRLFSFLPDWVEYGVLIVWLMAAMWLFFRPHAYVLGAADAGVYVNLGASISDTGSILIHDDFLASLNPDLLTAAQRPLPNQYASAYIFPAFFMMDGSSGDISPQFYHLYPTWMAIAYGLGGGGLSGMQAELLMSGFWGVLGAMAIYLTVRQVVGWETAVVALIALSLTALQVWFARYPTTETMTQYYLWVGFWAIGSWLSGRKPATLWAILAGVGLGIFFLVRIDSLFILPILGLFVMWLWLQGGWNRANSYFVLAIGLLIAHSLLHALWQSRPYFFDLFAYALILARRAWWVLAIAFAGFLISLGGIYRFRTRLIGLRRYRRQALLLVGVVIVLLAIYGWWIRPYTADVRSYIDPFGTNEIVKTDHENLLRLGWYLSPIGIWLGVAGICLMVWDVNRKTAVLLAVNLFFTLFYIWNISNNPHQIYAMRRYVPSVMPMFIVAGAYAIGWLLQRRIWWATAVAAVLTIGWLAGFAWSARGFVTQVDHKGLMVQIDDFNNQLDPQSIVLFNDPAVIGRGDFFGTMLRFVYEHDVLPLRDWDMLESDVLMDAIAGWQSNGRSVYWIGSPDWLDQQQIPYLFSPHTIASQTLEAVYTHKPTTIIDHQWDLPLFELTAP